jgi:DNA-binding protein H-NS
MAKEFDKLSVKELDAVIMEAQRVRTVVRERRRIELRREFESTAEAEGMTIAEIAGCRETTPAPKVKAPARYVHPDDASLVWSGLGRMPGLIDAGRTVDEFRIKEL